MTRERFISLVRSEQESLRRFLLSMCNGDAALADDIAQDALVRAYVSSGSFLGLSKFSTWLFRIAYNCFVDHCRKAHADDVQVEAAASVAASDSSDSAFRYQQLYQALERLQEKERAAISLFYFEDRSIKEISAILGIPQGTVKYHLSLGRNHLRQYIQL
jgi:RNA polymerase sigma-70 factor (ECF subfamily)